MVASAPAGQPIGADIEHIPPAVFDGFDSYALSPAERATLQADDAGSRLQLWVAKEAVLKAAGHGLSIEPHTLSISDSRCAGLPDAEGMELFWLDGMAGFASALAVPAGAEIIRRELAELLTG